MRRYQKLNERGKFLLIFSITLWIFSLLFGLLPFIPMLEYTESVKITIIEGSLGLLLASIYAYYEAFKK